MKFPRHWRGKKAGESIEIEKKEKKRQRKAEFFAENARERENEILDRDFIRPTTVAVNEIKNQYSRNQELKELPVVQRRKMVICTLALL